MRYCMKSPVLKPDMQPYRILVDIRNYEKDHFTSPKAAPNGTIAGPLGLG